MRRGPRGAGETDLAGSANARSVGSTDASPPADVAGGRRLVLVLGALSIFGPLSIDMYLPALPELARDLDASTSAAQLTLTACLAGLALGQLLAGPLSDRIGRRTPILVGVALYAVASLLCALAPSVGTLTALRFVQGAAGAAGVVVGRAVVRDLFSGVAAVRFYSALAAVNGLGPILAPVLGGQLLRVVAWHGVFVALGLIGSALLVASLWGVPESLPPERRSTGGVGHALRAMGGLLADRVFLGYTLACGLAFGTMFAYISGSPFVLQGIFGVSEQTFSLLFALNAVGIVLFVQLNRRLVERFSARRLLAAGLLLNTAGAFAVLGVVLGGAPLAAVLVALFVMVSPLGLVTPNATALALADHGAVAGSASALLGVLQFAVGAFAAPLVGLAGEGTAVPLGLVVAVLAAAALACFGLLTRTVRRPLAV